jgi:hypothetical protein
MMQQLHDVVMTMAMIALIPMLAILIVVASVMLFGIIKEIIDGRR